jgi:hypothetical protein
MMYNPNISPKATEWLAMSEDERMGLVCKYYESTGTPLTELKVHAATQSVVETYLATEVAAASSALDRLLAGGLTRQEATGAIGSVLEGFSSELTSGPRPDFNRRMYAALDTLSATDWKASAGGTR